MFVIGCFVLGDRGMICKRPDDRGAWIVPDRNSKQPEIGISYAINITKESGRIRFGMILGTVEEVRKQAYPEIVQLLKNGPREIKMATYEGSLGNSGGLVSVTYHGEKLALKSMVIGPAKRRRLFHDFFGAFPLSEEIIQEIKIAAERLAEQKQAELAVYREESEKRLADDQAKENELIKTDEPFVTSFFNAHPTTVAWFTKPRDRLTRNNVLEQAVAHGLAKPRGDTDCVGGTSYKHKFYQRPYTLNLHGTAYEFIWSWDDDDVDDW